MFFTTRYLSLEEEGSHFAYIINMLPMRFANSSTLRLVNSLYLENANITPMKLVNKKSPKKNLNPKRAIIRTLKSRQIVRYTG